MSAFWHWFVIAGTLLSLAAMLWLLLANRTAGGDNNDHEWDGITELDNPLPFWWVGMFVASIVFTLLYLAFYPGMGNFSGTGAWTSAGQHDEQSAAHEARFAPLYRELAALSAEDIIASNQGMQVGRRLFLNNCATCHGINGTGSKGFPNLTDDEWIWGGDLASVTHSIHQGRQAAMPGWVSSLGDTGVTNVAHYTLSLSGAEHDPALAAQGKAQYDLFCVACHQADGKGNALLGAPDLTNNIWLYGGTLVEVAESIAAGRSGNMPAQAVLIGPDRATILAAYVMSLQREH